MQRGPKLQAKITEEVHTIKHVYLLFRAAEWIYCWLFVPCFPGYNKIRGQGQTIHWVLLLLYAWHFPCIVTFIPHKSPRGSCYYDPYCLDVEMSIKELSQLAWSHTEKLQNQISNVDWVQSPQLSHCRHVTQHVGLKQLSGVGGWEGGKHLPSILSPSKSCRRGWRGELPQLYDRSVFPKECSEKHWDAPWKKVMWLNRNIAFYVLKHIISSWKLHSRETSETCPQFSSHSVFLIKFVSLWNWYSIKMLLRVESFTARNVNFGDRGLSFTFSNPSA